MTQVTAEDNTVIVFYHPRRIRLHSDRASEIRVEQMLRSFRRSGARVITIAGTSRTRHRRIRKLKREVKNGLRISFVYGESTNAPIALADKYLLPGNMLADYVFFSWMKQEKIPNGIFYRDIFWRFSLFKQQLAFPMNIIFKPLYWLDWYAYDRYWNLFFLPTASMNEFLPQPREKGRFHPLPPGFDANFIPSPPPSEKKGSPLHLLYVGGIEPAVYDIEPIIRQVGERPDTTLTICCRPIEWNKHKARYESFMTPNIRIVHAHGSGLTRYYHAAHAFAMLMPDSDYMQIAAPVKFYESIGYALPMISMGHREIRTEILNQDIGWIVDSPSHFGALLDELSGNDEMLEQKQQNLLAYRESCSWVSRCQYAANCLLGITT